MSSTKDEEKTVTAEDRVPFVTTSAALPKPKKPDESSYRNRDPIPVAALSISREIGVKSNQFLRLSKVSI